ncbi:hypothetical protein SteCoe_5569 [Stentor coeruleus]|uniref:Casein kinase I n=1 Tax=Stentor coeruleus TaxID=5963 RepID=A0A1R2CS36_9CILI|nr:hypothetical protein SteCoe_5569 [Stentor coeruleus]
MKRVISEKGYILEDKIGQGGFSEVYKISNSDNKLFALKVVEKSVLANLEYNFLKRLKNCKGIPKVYDFLVSNRANAIVMDYFEISIFDYFRNNPSFLTIFKFAIDGLKIIKRIHRRKIIHNDIKPNQFLYTKSNTLHLIDFGLSSKFIRKNKHISFKSNKIIEGSSTFASLNCHKGLTLSRRDDLTSFAYTLIYMALGSLPWFHISNKSPKEKWLAVEKYKLRISSEHLCEGLPKEFCQFLDYSQSLAFDEKPDYKYIISIFSKHYYMHKNETRRSSRKIGFCIVKSERKNQENEISQKRYSNKLLSYEDLDKTEKVTPPEFLCSSAYYTK